MSDTVSTQKRSAIMRAVRSGDTAPELIVRKTLHRMGLRFRLHRRDLPGTPDIVLPGRRTAIFVHGCYWHGHESCRRARIPKTRADYWTAKIRRNQERDIVIGAQLRSSGWTVVVLWECEIRLGPTLEDRLRAILPPPLKPKLPG